MLQLFVTEVVALTILRTNGNAEEDCGKSLIPLGHSYRTSNLAGFSKKSSVAFPILGGVCAEGT